jgi:hypothetical protein
MIYNTSTSTSPSVGRDIKKVNMFPWLTKTTNGMAD